MNNPFEILGVTPEDAADPDKLRAAWITAIRGAHPDATGADHHSAAQVNAAYEALQDPDLRAAIAATGDIQGAARAQNEARRLVAEMVISALMATDHRGQPLSPETIRKTVVRNVNQMRAEIDATIRKFGAKRQQLEAAQARLRFRGAGPDSIGGTIANTLAELAGMSRIEETKRWVAGEVERLGAEYDFEAAEGGVPAAETEWQRLVFAIGS